jgi:hypothetical protein
MDSFYKTITAAIADIEAHGYDSQARIDGWLEKIQAAARASATPEHVLQEALNAHMHAIYTRLVERGGILKAQKQITAFTVDRLKPALRSELDRRIMASAQLIKMNRKRAIADTEQRFSGWATSIPKGGTRALEKKEVKRDLRKALVRLPFEERRVLIDQGAKFTASLNNIVAVGGGAIALVWRSHWRRPGYHFREDHKERDGKCYTLRGNWALAKGFMKAGPAGYYDEITAVGEEVFCSCNAQYVFNVRDLPEDMITIKGQETLAAIRT